MWYAHKKPTFVSIGDFNKALKECSCRNLFLFDPHDENVDALRLNAYCWEDGRQNQHIMYRKPTGACVHLALDLFDLKPREDEDKRAYDLYRKYLQPLQKKYKEKIALDKNDSYMELVTEQHQWLNPEAEKTWRRCWSYDINSCFLSFLDKPLPSNRIIRMNSVVKDGEVGFIDDYGYIRTKKKGEFARWIFALQTYESLTEFKKIMYEKKQTTKNRKEKDEVKEAIVKTIGYLKKKNVFLRSMILNYANEYIKSFKDENTLYCNTDSIISTVERKDVPVGDECGLFKVEHENEFFIFKSIGVYSWYGERVKYRGIKRSQIKFKDGVYYIEKKYAALYDINKNRMVLNNEEPTKEILWHEPKEEQPTT